MVRVCVAGGAGFIGSHMAMRLRKEGHTVVVADVKRPEFFKEEELCDEFHLKDLRDRDNCLSVTAGCQWVLNFAADMGGMGFIKFNDTRIIHNSTLLSINMVEACRRNNVDMYFFASSACVYNEDRQTETNANDCALREEDAWPAKPQDAYGLEKLYAEEIAKCYGKDWGFKVRIARFHNIYGTCGTWRGGREKAPAAMCRKALCSKDEMVVWGDGEQTRSFCFVDDCVEGVWRLIHSDVEEPINLGSDEMVTINELASLAIGYTGRSIKIAHQIDDEAPQGVRGRSSDNTLIKKLLGWAPSTPLKEGLRKTFDWIQGELGKESEEQRAKYATSQVFHTVVDRSQPFPAI